MAVTDRVTAQQMGRAFAEMAREEPAARRLWVSTNGCEVELWLLTEPTDADTERRLYAASKALYDHFPEAVFFVDVLNPAQSQGWDAVSAIPSGVEEIPLRPA